VTQDRKRILIADDDRGALMIMRATLEAAGFVVTTAADGGEALRQFQHESFDLVMLDVDMPVVGGYDVCAAMRLQAGVLLPIVMVTGMDDVKSIDTAYSAGATDFITKPISWVLMGHRVRYWLRSYEIALELRTAEEGIRRLVNYDALTGLPNRAQFTIRLEAALERAAREALQVGVLYIDLDNFKRVNDTLGHGVGDDLLRNVTARLREATHPSVGAREVDSRGVVVENLSRLGGDEFLVLLPDIESRDDASLAAEHILRSLSQPMSIAGHDVSVTPSIGVAIYPADGEDQPTLIRNADLAMYFSKRQGAGSFAVFDPTMSAGALKRLTIERELRGAIDRNELYVEYQPQFNLRTGKIPCLEALLRWNNRLLGVVPPADFIPVAEECGLMLVIGEWVLRAVCVQAKEWHDIPGLAEVRLAVNVSGLQLSQRGFAGIVSEVLAASETPPALLELEITESVVMQNDRHAIQVLHELKAIGVEIAIDDFGTGHSSFARLRDFPLNRVKIDRTFIQHAHSDVLDHAIVAGIIRMAKALNLEIVAEGVEEQAQLLLLQDEACTLAQGYLLGRPMSPDAALKLLRRSQEAPEHSRTQRFNRLLIS
jgi:diguanylate cyclase